MFEQHVVVVDGDPQPRPVQARHQQLPRLAPPRTLRRLAVLATRALEPRAHLRAQTRLVSVTVIYKTFAPSRNARVRPARSSQSAGITTVMVSRDD